MGDLVLPPITWLKWDFMAEDGPIVEELKPPDKIHIGHVKQFCRYGISGPAREQFEKHKALRRQYGDQMTGDALEWLNDEIAALEIHASK